MSVEREVRAPAEAVWRVIETGGELDRWLPIVTGCRLDGEGAGSGRVCTVDGGELVGRIETVDPAPRLFQYHIHEQSLLPIREVLETMHVSPAPSGARVLWFLNFEIDNPAAPPSGEASAA